MPNNDTTNILDAARDGALFLADEVDPLSECVSNNCGHVDTDVTVFNDHGYMTPHDWIAVQEILLHVLGLLSVDFCEVCWTNNGGAAMDLDEYMEEAN